jgi:hypothetical protein
LTLDRAARLERLASDPFDLLVIGGGALGDAPRYLGAEAGAAYAERGDDDLLIRLKPGELRAWDFADEYDSAAP